MTTGGADIARNNGYSAYVVANPSPFLDLELGYTRSPRYALDTLSFSLGLNLGSLARHARR